jgi:hypothetical protein
MCVGTVEMRQCPSDTAYLLATIIIRLATCFDRAGQHQAFIMIQMMLEGCVHSWDPKKSFTNDKYEIII